MIERGEPLREQPDRRRPRWHRGVVYHLVRSLDDLDRVGRSAGSGVFAWTLSNPVPASEFSIDVEAVCVRRRKRVFIEFVRERAYDPLATAPTLDRHSTPGRACRFTHVEFSDRANNLLFAHEC